MSPHPLLILRSPIPARTRCHGRDDRLRQGPADQRHPAARVQLRRRDAAPGWSRLGPFRVSRNGGIGEGENLRRSGTSKNEPGGLIHISPFCACARCPTIKRTRTPLGKYHHPSPPLDYDDDGMKKKGKKKRNTKSCLCGDWTAWGK